MSAEVEAQIRCEVDEGLPDSEADGETIGVRADRYGTMLVSIAAPTVHTLSREGTYFVVTNPTPGTALAYNIQASFSDTVPLLYIFNQESQQNIRAKYIYLHYIKLIVSVAAVTGVQARFAIIQDIVARALGTDNTTTLTPVSTCSSQTLPSTMLIKAQNSATASAIAASSQNKRVMANGSYPSGLTIVGDELVIVCGETSAGAAQGLTAAQATCPGRKVVNAPPIVLAPGHSLTMHAWFPSNATTGLSYELEVGGWVK